MRCVRCKEVKTQVLHKVTLTHPQSKHLGFTRIRNPTVQRHCAERR